MILSRRSLITGLTALLAAPAIVRATSIMPVKPWVGDGVALWSVSHPGSVDVIPANFGPYIGLAQVKQEGMPTNFDPATVRYPTGEPICAGDFVYRRPDGRVYSSPDREGHGRVVGIAVTHSWQPFED